MTERQPRVGVVIVAAGRSERFGASDKVLVVAAGKPLLCWSIEAALAASSVADIVVVAGAHNRHPVEQVLAQWFPHHSVSVSTGGSLRQDSVLAGLAALPAEIGIVVTHDAARPLATPEMFDAAARIAIERGAAITAVPVTDTIKEVDGDRIVRTIDRSRLQAAQTPQAYDRAILDRAFSHARDAGVVFTDEAQMLEAQGQPVAVVPGSRTNLKVTVPEDLAMVDFLLSQRQGTR